MFHFMYSSLIYSVATVLHWHMYLYVHFADKENDSGSDDSDGGIGEVRFVPEDKTTCMF